MTTKEADPEIVTWLEAHAYGKRQDELARELTVAFPRLSLEEAAEYVRAWLALDI